ncbi:hypothetical protein IU452_33165 [Nocardia transvalensis]|nr:hypothetical protein [Nocardia transvalensis]
MRSVPPDPQSERVRQVVQRARKAGYRLIRDPRLPHQWQLLDLADGERIYSAATLDQIEQWLST